MLRALDDLTHQDSFTDNQTPPSTSSSSLYTIDNLNQPMSSYNLFYSSHRTNDPSSSTTTADVLSSPGSVNHNNTHDDNITSSSSSGKKGKNKHRNSSGSSITSFTNSLSNGFFNNHRSKDREAAILETLEIAQQRIVHLVIELDNAKVGGR